jgi:alpha-tubulin suppressor-like RCC1 family protein
MPIIATGVQYSGIWTMQQVNAAIAASTWPVPPGPALWSWGYGGNGRLGLGNTTDYSSPKQVGSLITWATTAAGSDASAAIKLDGTLWTWGYNIAGQLGLGNTTQYSSPMQVGALTNWSKIAIGTNGGFYGVKTDGTLWSWGLGSLGRLGLGNTTSYSSPKQIGALTAWLNVSAGNYYALATKTDGTLWSWGYNGIGQLGQGNLTNRSSPTQIGALTNWSKVSAGTAGTVLAVKTDGTLWSWGNNTYGGLGLSNLTDYSSPKQIGALTAWLNVSAAYTFSVAIKTDGTIWSWGQGSAGQLGLGNTTSYSSPKQIGAQTYWTSIVNGSGTSSSAAIKNDGTIWTWGNNYSGQLGLGNSGYTNRSSPTQVGSLATWQSVAIGSSNMVAIKLQ